MIKTDPQVSHSVTGDQSDTIQSKYQFRHHVSKIFMAEQHYLSLSEIM